MSSLHCSYTRMKLVTAGRCQYEEGNGTTQEWVDVFFIQNEKIGHIKFLYFSRGSSGDDTSQ